MYNTGIRFAGHAAPATRTDADYIAALEQKLAAHEGALVAAMTTIAALKGEVAALKAAGAPAPAPAAGSTENVLDAAAVARAAAADRARVAALQEAMRQRTANRWKEPLRLAGPVRGGAGGTAPGVHADAADDDLDPRERMKRRSAERWRQPTTLSGKR